MKQRFILSHDTARQRAMSAVANMKRACVWCHRDPDEPYETSHGICDECLRKYFPEEAELILGQEEHYDYPTP